MQLKRPAQKVFKKQVSDGDFWDPTNPAVTVRAAFHLGRHGRSKLIISRTDHESGTYPLEQTSLAHGRLSDGRLVTLWAEADMNFVMVSDEKRFQRWDTALIGGHVGNEQSTIIRSSSFTFDGIETWTRTGPIPSDAPRREFEPAVLLDTYSSGIDIVVSIKNPAVFETMQDGSERFRRFPGADGRICFELSTPAPLALHRRLWFDLRALVTFATQEPGHLFDFYVTTDDGVTLQIFEYRPGSPPATRKHGSKMLVSPAQVDPSVLFPRWWHVIDAFYPVPQILVGKHYSRRSFLEHETLAAIAAAEVLHKLLKFGDTRFSAAFFRSRKKAIRDFVENLPDSDQSIEFDQFLNEVLANRKTFRMRLKELGAYAGPEHLCAADIDIESWVRAVGKVRNLLAHTGSHVKSRTGSNDDLLGAVDHATRAVLSLAIRKQLGEGFTPQHAQRSLLSSGPKLRLAEAD